MLNKFRKAINRGVIVRKQMFQTDKGFYQIDYIRFEGNVYFVKYHNSKVVEICNLSECKPLVNPFKDKIEMVVINNESLCEV